MKTLSIIGIVWFSVSLISVITFGTSGELAAATGWGMIGLFYALPFSIICYKKSKKPLDSRAINDFSSATTDFLKLKENGILTEDKFQKKKGFPKPSLTDESAIKEPHTDDCSPKNGPLYKR